MTLESPAARAGQLARQLLLFGRIIPPEELVARIEAIDATHVRDLAGAHFRRHADAGQRRAGQRPDGPRQYRRPLRRAGRRVAPMAFLRSISTLNSSPTIRAERVLLRAPVLADYPQWAKLREDSRAFLAPWEPVWPADDLAKLAFRRRIRRYQREIRNGTGYPFFIFSPDGETPSRRPDASARSSAASPSPPRSATGWARPLPARATWPPRSAR